jgi:hypothetical protein
MDLAPREPPLNADPDIQLRLLEVQDKDTRLTQLAHRARTLPDAARLAELDTRWARLRDEVVAADTIVGDLELQQAKADQDVEQVRDRATRDRDLLDSGSIGDPKQLQSLQSELESLGRRQADLEVVELEIMERVEGARGRRQLTRSEMSWRERDRSRRRPRPAGTSTRRHVESGSRPRRHIPATCWRSTTRSAPITAGSAPLLSTADDARGAVSNSRRTRSRTSALRPRTP